MTRVREHAIGLRPGPLRRSRRHRLVAGVCGGLALQFGVPTAVGAGLQAGASFVQLGML